MVGSLERRASAGEHEKRRARNKNMPRGGKHGGAGWAQHDNVRSWQHGNVNLHGQHVDGYPVDTVTCTTTIRSSKKKPDG